MTPGLTTHVLDTSREGPAEGVNVTLREVLDEDETKTITEETTNSDGRLGEPLLTEEEIQAGTYELVFDVGSYYQERATETTFLETVPVQFTIADPLEHYHVPLLLSPGGYTTYRGS